MSLTLLDPEAVWRSLFVMEADFEKKTASIKNNLPFSAADEKSYFLNE